MCSISATKYQNKPYGQARGAYAGWGKNEFVRYFHSKEFWKCLLCVCFFLITPKMSILKQKKSNFIQDHKQISQNESSKILESVEINKLPITCYFTPIKVWNLESALSLGAHLFTGGQWYILAYNVMGAF